MVAVLPESGHGLALDNSLRFALRSIREETLSTIENFIFCGEPTIDELLCDPVAQTIMRYDGIDEDVVRDVIAQAERRMRTPPRAS
jgi:hypothetical protein